MAKTTIHIECEYCGKKFDKLQSEYKRTKHHFCSKECRYIGSKVYLSNKVKINCANCNEELERVPYEIEKNENHYCDKKCQTEHRNKEGFHKGENNANYKGGELTLTCPDCGVEFKKSRGAYNAAIKKGQKKEDICCSQKCGWKWKKKTGSSKRGINMTEFSCEYCGELFMQYASQRRREHKFCSPECRMNYYKGERCHNYIGRVEYTCDNCGKECSISRSETGGNLDRRFCGVDCKTEYMRGENATNWKGGIAPLSIVLRGIKEYQEWMAFVLSRDNYTCTECGSKEDVQVHHIEFWGKLISRLKIKSVEQARVTKELWNTDNGVSLCIQCHAEKHPRYKELMLKKIA